MLYSFEECVLIVHQYWVTSSFKQCQSGYLNKFGGRTPPTRATISNLAKKLERTRNLVEPHKGRQPKMTEDNIQDVKQRLLAYPRKFHRRLSQETGSETFNAVSDDFDIDPDKNQVDLSSWHDCQTDLQPTFIVEHSNETENLVALLRRAEEKRSQLIPLTQTARLASQVDTNLLWHRGRGKGRGRWKGRHKRKDVRKGKMKGIQTTLKLGENNTAGNTNLLNGVQEKDQNSINKTTPNLSDFEANMLQHCFITNEDNRCPVAEDVVIVEEEPDCETLYGISTEDKKLIKEILSNIGETIRNERQQRNPLFLNFPTVGKIFSANKNENKEQRTINFNRKSYPYDINVVMSKGAFEHVDLDVVFSEVNSSKVLNYSDNRIILNKPICRAPNCDEFNNVDKRRSDATEVNRSANFIATPQFDLMLGDLLFEDEEMAEIDDDVSVMKTGVHEDNPIPSEKPREMEFEKLVPNISIKENTKIQTDSDCIHGASSPSVINNGGKDMSASKPLQEFKSYSFFTCYDERWHGNKRAPWDFSH
uniref:DUF4817 domain-containing protein n=1 Tax=Timema cristinae TaxID=61476 RepID=A0A7R9CCP0_TIMCR|nr:unnamed protein product [Timema cristinae]